jgi:tetratricopeptide (TPR) repeat protein
MRRIAITLIYSAVLLAAAGAQTRISFPDLAPDSRAEAYGRRGAGGYSWEDLAEISLWASASPAESAGPARGPSFLEQIRAAAEELARSPDTPEDLQGRGEYILTYIHKKFLTAYSLQQTRLDTLLTNGRYNCVSSAVLYLILGTAAGLDIRGVMTKDHAFVAVRVNGGWIDVETTNPYGFDPGNRKEFHDQFGKATGFAYVPARNYRDRVFISPIELVSLIFSNRITEMERQNRFAEAVPLAVSRAGLLLGGKPAGAPAEGGEQVPFFENPRRDLLNRIFNFGAFLLKGGREEDALRWAAFAQGPYPDEERWQEFIFAAVNNRLVKLTQAGRLAEARDTLNLHAPLLNTANFDRLDMTITDAELLKKASGMKDPAEAAAILAAIDEAEGRVTLPPGRAGELRTFVIEKAASLIAAGPGRNWSGAIAFIEEALKEYGPNPRLEQSLRNYRSNLAVEYHNRFAAAWNRRDQEEAARILEEGLALFPDNRQLLADRAVVERAGQGW